MNKIIQPRPYQQRCLDAIRESARKGNRRILVVSPTGSGKMLMAAMLMQSALDKENHAAFFADKRELVKQNEVELRRLGVTFGTIMADETEYHAARAKVVSKDTLWSRAFRQKKIAPPRAECIILDEAHRSMSKTWGAVAAHYNKSFVIGFTATPCRMDGKGLGDFYDDLIVMATYKELQGLGFIVPVRLFAPTKPDLKGLRSSKGDYAKTPLEDRMDEKTLVGNIVTDWASRAADRVTIAFASGIRHSLHIRNEFRDAGYIAEHIDGKTETAKRDEILRAFRNGEINVLSNYGVLTEGVDAPICKCIILARPTKSFALFRQMTGRAQRPYDGYSDCIVLDHSAAWQRHGFPDEDVDWELSTSVRIQDKIKAKKEKDKDAPRDPFCCEQCKTVYRGPHCPVCGFCPERSAKKVPMAKGTLSEIQRKRRKTATLSDRQKDWDKFLGWAIATNRTPCSAAGRYRQQYGVWPRGLVHVPRGKYQWHMLAREFYHEYVTPQKREKALA